MSQWRAIACEELRLNQELLKENIELHEENIELHRINTFKMSKYAFFNWKCRIIAGNQKP